jgi:hypothetical protein
MSLVGVCRGHTLAWPTGLRGGLRRRPGRSVTRAVGLQPVDRRQCTRLLRNPVSEQCRVRRVCGMDLSRHAALHPSELCSTSTRQVDADWRGLGRPATSWPSSQTEGSWFRKDGFVVRCPAVSGSVEFLTQASVSIHRSRRRLSRAMSSGSRSVLVRSDTPW